MPRKPPRKAATPAPPRDKTGRSTRARGPKQPAASRASRATSLHGALSDFALDLRQQQALRGIKPPRRPRSRPDKCQPAADATEALILESLADPTHRPLTIEQRCDALGIARSTWYRHTTDPLFRARASDAFRAACGDSLGPVLDVLCHSATIEGKDGHQDRKLYLQLLGVVDENPAARRRGRGDDDDTPAGGDRKPAAEMSDGDLLAAFDGRTELLPPGVQRRMGLDPDAGKTNGDGTAA